MYVDEATKNPQDRQVDHTCTRDRLISYFGYHSINGDRGLNARQQFERKAAELEVRLESLVAERKRLQQQVMLLPQNGPVVKDMLDERAREALNLTRPNEIIIYDF